jgi:hypothetical protein
MRIIQAIIIFAGVIALANQAFHLNANGAEAEPLPAASFQEVYDLVRSNLAGTNEAELNEAAVEGFLNQLESRAGLVSRGSGEAETPQAAALGKTAVYEGAYAYLRVAHVGAGLGQELGSTHQRLSSTNRLAGVILDLRYAGGQDYAAAAEAADQFTSIEQPLLSWESITARSTQMFSIDLPVIVLINRQTSGAAEALAAVLREAAGGVIIGEPSAGLAYVFKEMVLSDGRRLRIASGSVQAGKGATLSGAGLVPDIRIAVDPEQEKVHFEDPYKASPRLGEAKGTDQGLNRTRRRINESDLIRMQREGIDFEQQPSKSEAAPLINDPALSRALDILKGLAFAQRRR